MRLSATNLSDMENIHMYVTTSLQIRQNPSDTIRYIAAYVYVTGQ